MSTMLSPGVYPNEVDYSNYVAAAADSSIGIVGGASKGPLDATTVTSQEELVKVFGEPVDGDYGIYCALEALSQASSLIYQRAYHNSVTASAGSSATDKLMFTSVSSGSANNGIKIVVTYTSDSNFGITITDASDKQLESYTELSLTSTNAKYVLSAINGVSKYITVAINDSGQLAAGNYTLSGGEDGISKGTAGDTSSIFTITTKTNDSTLNGCIVKFTDPDTFGYFDMNLYKADATTIIEHIANLSLDSTNSRYIDNVILTASEYLNVVFHSANYTKGTTKLSSPQFIIKGGNDGISGLTTTDIITAIDKFENPEVLDINLFAIPGNSNASVIAEGIKIAESRGDCLYIIDPPKGLTPSQLVDWTNATGDYSTNTALDTSYAAVFGPWVQVNDPYSDSNKWLPASGDVLAQFAYNDTVAHPWFAAAGMNRGVMKRVINIEYSATKSQRDTMYGNRNCVNPIISYLGTGIIIYGNKTTQRAVTALDRINVRRLLCYIKKKVDDISNPFLFDPNDTYEWANWIEKVDPILASIKALRGLYDYKITMAPTSTEIENNQMPGTVMVKPTKDAEFIPINFMIVPYSTELSDNA